MKIDWIRKLTSRKFWVSLAGLAAGIIIYCGGSEDGAKQTEGLIMAAASVVGYTLGEGLTDAAGVTVKNFEKKEDEDNES